jgi:hypothetical protein
MEAMNPFDLVDPETVRYREELSDKHFAFIVTIVFSVDPKKMAYVDQWNHLVSVFEHASDARVNFGWGDKTLEVFDDLADFQDIYSKGLASDSVLEDSKFVRT